MNRLRKVELYKQLRHSLTELEQSPDRAVSVATSLLRYATATHMVYNMLPAGRTVAYKLADEEETIPSSLKRILSNLNQPSPLHGAIAEGGKKQEGARRPVGAVRPIRPENSSCPQWVAFNENGDLLVKSVEEAQAHIKSMQRFMELLFLAVALAPYVSADEEYARKRYGMLGQLV